MKNRSRARELALQLLFQRDLNPDVSREDILLLARTQMDDDELLSFSLTLYDGAVTHLGEIDERLSSASDNWRLVRMAAIDRNILRLGAFELLYFNDTPASVVLDEAIELARRFSTADSPSFINGVLDRLHRERLAGTPVSETPIPAQDS